MLVSALPLVLRVTMNDWRLVMTDLLLQGSLPVVVLISGDKSCYYGLVIYRSLGVLSYKPSSVTTSTSLLEFDLMSPHPGLLESSYLYFFFSCFITQINGFVLQSDHISSSEMVYSEWS